MEIYDNVVAVSPTLFSYSSPSSSSSSPTSQTCPISNTIPPPPSRSSPSSSLHPPPPSTAASLPQAVISPCAACKILRRRCVEKCVLAPYFPPTEPYKFTIVHKVYGASNIIKFLLELPEWQREDAVSSMVYEANARIRDPVYGCAGTICCLQKQVGELQAQLAKSEAELVNMQCQQANLVALLCMETAECQEPIVQQHYIDTSCSLDDNNSAHNGNLYGPEIYTYKC